MVCVQFISPRHLVSPPPTHPPTTHLHRMTAARCRCCKGDILVSRSPAERESSGLSRWFIPRLKGPKERVVNPAGTFGSHQSSGLEINKSSNIFENPPPKKTRQTVVYKMSCMLRSLLDMMCFFIKQIFRVSYCIWKVKQSFLAQNQSTVINIMCINWNLCAFWTNNIAKLFH